MRAFIHRLLGLARAPGFDAAGGGWFWEGSQMVEGLNAAILAGAITAARRGGVVGAGTIRGSPLGWTAWSVKSSAPG